jgi:hypothetical protein
VGKDKQGKKIEWRKERKEVVDKEGNKKERMNDICH